MKIRLVRAPKSNPFILPGLLFAAEGDAGGGTTDTSTADQTSAGDAEDSKGESDAKTADDADKDWQAEFEAQKRVNRSLERKTKSDLSRITGLESDLKGLREGATKKSEGDAPDVEAIREQARVEARAEVLKDRVADKIAVAAAKTFADPGDAAVYLASQVDDFIDNGKVDAEAIADALADLLKKKPYLAVQDGKRFKGDADGGTRKESSKSIDDQIAEARKAGKFQLVIALKEQQHASLATKS